MVERNSSRTKSDRDRAIFPELHEDKPRMDLCTALARGEHKSEVVLVHHLHETALSYIRSLASGYTIRKVIGIQYSAVPSVVEELRRDFDVVVPADFSNIKKVVQQEVEGTPKSLIIDEIGGYTTEIADIMDRNPLIAGVVEDTNQGHWLWQQAKLNRLPVLSIAQSNLKKLENPFVGKAIIYGTYCLLRDVGLPDLSERRVMVIGFGNIGSEVARHIRPLCKGVLIYDTDENVQLRASLEFEISRDFSKVDTVIGVTGNPLHSIKSEDLKAMNDGTLLVSGSSKRVEFGLDGFGESAETYDESDPTLYRYTIEGREILVANGGQPINLQYTALPSKILDLVYGSLIQCINLLDQSAIPPGLHSISEEDQRAIIRKYISIYGIDYLRA